MGVDARLISLSLILSIRYLDVGFSSDQDKSDCTQHRDSSRAFHVTIRWAPIATHQKAMMILKN